MPRLQLVTKTKRETVGVRRHQSYHLVLPAKIVQQMRIADGTILHATVSERTGAIRLHPKKTRDSRQVRIHRRLTKTYRGQRYYSAKVTIPVSIARRLNLQNDNLEVDCTKDTITIRKNTAAKK